MKKIFALVAIIFAGACFHRSAPETLQPETTLRIENRAFLDMNIYLVRGSERTRLGMAPGNSTTILPIPARVIFGPTTLKFQADPIGGPRQPVSEEIIVNAGDEVSMLIPPG